MLRTALDAGEDGQPFQRIAPPAAVVLPAVDLSGLPPDVREAEASRVAAEEATRPFDLARGPLARWRRLVLGDRENLLLATSTMPFPTAGRSPCCCAS